MKHWLSVAALVAFVTATPARADCGQFKWSTAKELLWFSNNPAPVASGGRIATFEVGYTATLAKLDAAKLTIQPTRSSAADTFSAVLDLPSIATAGLYQITLSDEAWIDVSQNGVVIPSIDFSGQKDCPGIRKTVRFHLEKGDATLQLSDAKKDSMNISIYLVD